MQIDLNRFDTLAARNAIKQGSWGDGRERACLMSALVAGATSPQDCAAQGWPLWLAEISVWLFDSYPRAEAVDRGHALATAIRAADERGADWDVVFRRVRTDAILPIAMESIGDGNEPWRVDCRRVVQWSIDNDGRAAWAAEAAGAARAAGAAWAAGAAGAARAAGAAARDRIETALLNAMEG